MNQSCTPKHTLRGARNLFGRVVLPATLPTTLERLSTAQQRWFSPILTGPDRPRYIGSWNATAMFMTALFAQPSLAATQVKPEPLLPPGGPIFKGLQMLHKAGLLRTGPVGSELDDQAFEPGALYENNNLLTELRRPDRLEPYRRPQRRIHVGHAAPALRHMDMTTSGVEPVPLPVVKKIRRMLLLQHHDDVPPSGQRLDGLRRQLRANKQTSIVDEAYQPLVERRIPECGEQEAVMSVEPLVGACDRPGLDVRRAQQCAVGQAGDGTCTYPVDVEVTPEDGLRRAHDDSALGFRRCR